MNAYLPKNYLGPFRVECYNNKLVFHGKEQCFKNGLKTKKSDLELNFLCPHDKRHTGCGAHPVMKALSTGLPQSGGCSA